MKRIFSLLKKAKPNHLILLNIIIILIIFTGINKYNEKNFPIKSEQEIDGINYTLLINSHKYTENSVMIINLIMNNKNRKEKQLNIKREVLFNVEVFKENTLVFKRDYIDKLAGKSSVIQLRGYSKITAGYEWNFIPNGEVKALEQGKYMLRVYSKDLKIEMKIPFEISEEGA